MPTYTIVAAGTNPLGPFEISAGTTIQANDGDVFIIDSSANADVRFAAQGSGSAEFDVQINESNFNGFRLIFESDVTANVDLADNVFALGMNIRANQADEINFTAGDNAWLGSFVGSGGDDSFVAGDNFTMQSDISLGGGNDTLSVGDNSFLWDISGGEGDDSLTLGDDADILDLFGDAGADTINVGNNLLADDIAGGSGDDSISLGDGATIDDFFGGGGEDTITFGDDLTADRVRGNGGDDTVIIGSGADINSISGSGGNDALISETDLPGATSFEAAVCFTRGTVIETDRGPMPIHKIKAGDRVVTMDHGLQTVRWIGCTKVDGRDHLAPVRIRKGALGNRRALWVSQQHRMLITGWLAELLFGQGEVLVAAKHLVDGDAIRIIEKDDVEYYHMLFDQHEIVYAEGVASESFHPGCVGMSAISHAARTEIYELFPELVDQPAVYGPSSRKSLRGYEGHLLSQKR